MDFSEGLRRCKQYGAHLPEVTTSGETSFLKNTFGEKIFLGATDKLTEGHWVWENTQQAVGFQDWHQGEPNNSKEEDCLEIYRSSWNDINCTNKQGIVCEFDI
ncbi:hypothetical protein DPMN_118809 [Dreissena polymorpha]|uniref:C-type lectin domain-containing protein n=1 Tax=Dreissena polymorpha TaxID=45954 RepID=A0A9D4GH51_DREPO|nr:hypothetical protein DPMN_118809 [Dreissena polymorpha]